ncbi:hypothetical protein K469DRAFT_724656 [Zopfia rhizophila CBS 207.26]|uniref:DUF6594 domain-containing protein n=1 Tax=Zopfia rhizophila CBS 207.26 TaxID=1314779 RepID=A0A6A6D7D2_9PEZI|nr:hypothetical protein K469DRAFT_724656 [Zopfia rhizophila CBS 207.26]
MHVGVPTRLWTTPIARSDRRKTSRLPLLPFVFQPQASPFAEALPIELRKSPPRAYPNLQPTTNNEPNEKEKKEAWRYEGYQEYWKWMASDDDFFIFRRFQNLNAGIEARLEQIHKDNANAPETRRNDSFRWDSKKEEERHSLMCELTGLLHHYNKYIESFSKVRERPRAEERQIQNVEEYRKEGRVIDKEMNFIEQKGDLISIKSSAPSPIGRFLAGTRLIRSLPFIRAKEDPEVHAVSPYNHYASEERLANLTTGSVIVLGCMMLLGPMWWLNFISDNTKRLAVITGFLVIFMGSMATATANKPFEVVASGAAYAAVLMIFMQIKVD